MADGHDRGAPGSGAGHEGHAHGASADADSRKLTIALGLILGFTCVEVKPKATVPVVAKGLSN